MKREKTLERKRWAMVFYELNIISQAVFNDFIDSDYDYDERLSQLLMGARKVFLEKGFSKDWVTFYGHYFQRTFTVPKVSHLAGNKKLIDYEVWIDLTEEEGDYKMAPIPKIRVCPINNREGGMNLPNIQALEDMRLGGELEFKETYKFL